MDDSVPVSLEPKHVYGIRPEVIGNIKFNLNQEVIYPVEAVIVFHDYVKNKQRFLRLPPSTAPAIIALNTPRNLMAIVEIATGEDREFPCEVVVYDLSTLKKQRSFQLPTRVQYKKITAISFTCDSNAVVALSDYPDEMVYMFLFDRLGTVIEGRAGNTNHRGMANFICCNPCNEDYVAVCGDGVMKLMTKSEKGFSYHGDLKPEFNATSLAWVSSDMLIIGTNQGILILFEHSTQKTTFRAKDIDSIDLTAEPDPEEQSYQEPTPIPGTKVYSKAIVCMIAFPKGLAFAIFNQVYVFEKISKTKYERKTILDIPINEYTDDLYQIHNMAINTKQDTVIVTPKHNQIYVGILIVPESLKTQRLEFKTLGELLHIDEIIDIGVSSWKPIVVSSSKDKTIRIWNYRTEKVELVKSFSLDVTVLELFPSGQYVAVGFIDRVKVMQIFMDDLNLIKTYNFPHTTNIKVSYFGHLMATAYESSIAITSIFNFETFKTIKGHEGIVTAIAWAQDDKSIVSGGDDGLLFQWDIQTGARLQHVSHPGTVYKSLCVPKNSQCIYAATDLGTIRYIKNSKVMREIKLHVKSPVLDIALARSDLIMFASNKIGHLYNVQMPLCNGSGGELTKYSYFDSAVTKIRFSHDGTLLITCSARGTLVFWQLKNIEGKVAPIDQDLLKSQEVLISRNELEEKIERIKYLEVKLKQQAAEFYKKQTQNEENDQQQMADTHKGYCEALGELKAKNDEIGVRHAVELTQITSQIDELSADHEAQMDIMAQQYSERMLMEYQKFYNLRESMLKVRDSYEEKLSKSEGCLSDTAKALEKDFKKQLEERQELIRQLMKEMDDKKLEFAQYCRQVDIDNDRRMIDKQIEYEKKVKFERDEKTKWKGQADASQSKYDILKKDGDYLLKEVAKLKEVHYKSKATIADLKVDINDLHKDVADREYAISVKERRIEEINTKNQELEKYKQVLNHKITELKAQIEPRELQILEKRKQIAEMEQELNGLHKNNLQLELQLKEIKDMALSANIEVKVERARAKSARVCITNICSEIYQVAANLNRPDKLREGIKYLFHKYSSDDALKKFVTLDTQIQADLNRQRGHIEKIMIGCRQKMQEKSYLGKSKKLISENRILLNEIADIARQNDNIRVQIANLGLLVKICTRAKARIDTRSKKETLLDMEIINQYFYERIYGLETQIKSVLEDNEKMNEEIVKKRKQIYKS